MSHSKHSLFYAEQGDSNASTTVFRSHKLQAALASGPEAVNGYLEAATATGILDAEVVLVMLRDLLVHGIKRKLGLHIVQTGMFL